MNVINRIRPTVTWVLACAMYVVAHSVGHLTEQSQMVTVGVGLITVLTVLGRRMIAAEINGVAVTIVERIRPTIMLIVTFATGLSVWLIEHLSDPDYIVTVVNSFNLLVVGFSGDIIESEKDEESNHERD